MKVSQLINKLRQFPESWPVMIRGYEDGVNEVKAATPQRFEPNLNPADYLGNYNISDNPKDPKCVFLIGNER